jgi:hypothetical protein
VTKNLFRNGFVSSQNSLTAADVWHKSVNPGVVVFDFSPIYLEDEDCFKVLHRSAIIAEELAKIQCYKCKGYGHLSCQCQKAHKETIVEENMESCQKEAVIIPNSSPKEAMVQ